jgi:hypothetical protein
MQILLATQQAHARKQPNKAKIVISMQMGYEDVVDPAPTDLIAAHLHLGAFAAIYKKKLVIHGHQLGSRMPVKSRDRRVIAENGYCQHRDVLKYGQGAVTG